MPLGLARLHPFLGVHAVRTGLASSVRAGTWADLWFHTGDRVVRDATGRHRFVGRLKKSIRRRGENVSAWEVEQVLIGRPAIAEAAVCGVDGRLERR